MRTSVTIFILSLFFFSCNNVEIKKVFYPDGKLKTVKHYWNGKQDGISLRYTEEGRIQVKENWKNGIRDTVDYPFCSGGIKVIYDKDEKMESVSMRLDSTDKYESISSKSGLAYSYIERPLVSMGDTEELNLFLLSPNQGAPKFCRLFIGEGDTSLFTIIGAINEINVPPSLYVKYSIVAKDTGKHELTGYFEYANAENGKVIKYPFKNGYYVKSK